MSYETQSVSPESRPVERVLDLARWAPSGDNTQPWRFEIRDDHHVVVHGHDTRDHVVYDLDGRASQLALGALLETIDIAASGERMRAHVTRRTDSPETRPTFDVTLSDEPGREPDPLLPYVTERVTQRRPMRTTPLRDDEIAAFNVAVGDGYTIAWKADSADRRRIAKLLFRSAWVRLTIREAYEVHRQMIEWGARYSEDRIPDRAVGLDPVALKLMRWAMGSFNRVHFMNRYLGGTLLPRLQLDYQPAVRCAAHFMIIADRPLQTIDDWIDGGRALQRFWLMSAKLGLLLQPEMTPLIFSRYVHRSLRFCDSDAAMQRAREVHRRMSELFGDDVYDHGVFMGRVGHSAAPRSRSTRLPLSRQMIERTS